MAEGSPPRMVPQALSMPLLGGMKPHGDPMLAARRDLTEVEELRAAEAAAAQEEKVTVVDALGTALPVEHTIDAIKNRLALALLQPTETPVPLLTRSAHGPPTAPPRFFALGLQTGLTLQMFAVSIVLMIISYDPRTGAVFELARTYYPLFRGLFFLCFFGVAYGLCLSGPHTVHCHTVHLPLGALLIGCTTCHTGASTSSSAWASPTTCCSTCSAACTTTTPSCARAAR